MTFPRFLLPLALLTAPALAQTSAPPPAAPIANPVLPGDFPDPSVTKIGDLYWASATSSDWAPLFPLLTSKDLRTWQLVGHVFPQGQPQPAWADHYFWAPEISQDGGRTYVYYAAHQKNGNLAVAVASADRPEGPYRDHGPLVGQADGSIDAFPMRDENGQLYLIWKEDGNSIQQPTPIWAQPLNEARTALTGEKRELFRNAPGTWEGGLVEGVSMVRHDGYFYAFYAGNGCCGNGCTYATGVARAKTLLGPWEKNPANPVLVSNEAWKCPGHGTPVEQAGRWYLLYHAYAAQGFEHIGRQGVLSEFTWGAAGWPEFTGRGVLGGPTPAPVLARTNVRDEFAGNKLSPAWQWPVLTPAPVVALRGGQLHLTARPEGAGAVLGHGVFAAGYEAQTTVLRPAAVPAGTAVGLAAVGSPNSALALTVGGRRLTLWKREKGKQTVLAEVPLPTAGALCLRVRVREATQYQFDYSLDQGRRWRALPGVGAMPVSGTFLPTWDLGVRVGVLAQGPASGTGVFEDFQLKNL